MIALLVLLCVSLTQAPEPAHLRPGALVGHLGQVSLVEDVLWVRYPYARLNTVPPRLSNIVKQMNQALTQLEQTPPLPGNSIFANRTLINLLLGRLTFINETLALALESYLGLDGPGRFKRGWVDGIGDLSREMFGTAMNRDVVALRERFNHLVQIASSNKRTINLTCKNLARLVQHVSSVATYLTYLKTAFDNLLQDVQTAFAFVGFNQALPTLEDAVNSLVHTNARIMQNVVDAAQGRVTPTLFPVHDFLHVLRLEKMEYDLNPLFDINGLHHYYPLLESFVTSDALVIHVPFQSKDTFEVYQIEPFPFEVNHTLMTLDLPPSMVLISKDFTVYAEGSVADLNKCKQEYYHNYHCPASLFAFLPITGGICEVEITLVNATKALALCPYKMIVPKPLFHKAFFNYHYFYFSKPFYISVVCPEDTTYKQVSGHLAVFFACYVRSANLTTYPSKIHQGFTSNFSARIFPLTGLESLNISSIKYVTNSLKPISFNNASMLETAVQDSLPEYLAPYVHYPSMFAPIFVVILILIPLGFWVRKALVLYLHLRRRTTQTEQVGETPV